MTAVPADEGEVPGPPVSGKTGNRYLVRRGLDIPQLNEGHDRRHSAVILEGSDTSVLKAASVSKEKKEEARLFNGSRKVQLGA